MPLDKIASVCCGLISIFLFTLHIVSSPRRHNWMNIPEYVRMNFLITGTMFMWRSANFWSVSSQPAVTLGHINAEGVLANMALTCLVASITFWVFFRILPSHGWDRVEYVRKSIFHNPHAAPVVMDMHEIAEVNRATGIATIEPGESGTDVFEREARRSKRPKVMTR